jgi:predicted RNA binding protein YcfA (HicA-like mRNA interferase family)
VLQDSFLASDRPRKSADTKLDASPIQNVTFNSIFWEGQGGIANRLSCGYTPNCGECQLPAIKESDYPRLKNRGPIEAIRFSVAGVYAKLLSTVAQPWPHFRFSAVPALARRRAGIRGNCEKHEVERLADWRRKMPKVPSENYERIVAALQRLGFQVVRQRGSHIRLERRLADGTVKITVPAQRPVKRSTLSRILKQAEIALEIFLAAL